MSKFIQVVLYDGALVALDSNGDVWQWSADDGVWYEFSDKRVSYVERMRKEESSRKDI